MPTRDVVVVGASAGGVEALRELVRGLPADLPATVLVVLHLPSSAYSALPVILSRSGPLPALSAEDDAPLKPGTILVAPPDRHLVIRDGHVVLGRGPKENGHRPAVDVLFRSAARWHGSRTVGLVLSGTLDDGAAGLHAVAERHGVALVQDPDDALYAGMPLAALRAVPSARRAPILELAKLVAGACTEPARDVDEPVGRTLEMETDMAEFDEGALGDEDRPGRPAALSCPDCNGAMFEFDEGTMMRYRCRVGHAWSPESLAVEHVEAAESALWIAVRALEEKSALHRRLGGRLTGDSSQLTRAYHAERAHEAQHSASVIRQMLSSLLSTGMEELPLATGESPLG